MIPRQHDQRSLTVRHLVAAVNGGYMALPDFQRPYRWNDDKVRTLLASIFQGWPAGLLLLMECPPSGFFAMRKVEGGPSIHPPSVDLLILDGQQRITALTQVFRKPEATGSPVWCLDVKALEEAATPEDLESAFVIKADPGGQASLFRDADDRFLPLWRIIDEDDFFEWRSSVVDGSSHSKVDRGYAWWTALWAERLSAVGNYGFPSVILGREMPLSAVAGIFERLNTAGMPLDTFDLVVAHVYRDGKNLRQMWATAADERPILQRFVGDDPQIVVEAVALRRRGDTRRDSLLSLQAEELWGHWPKVVEGLERACWFLDQHAGIRGARDIPHRAILLVLATLAWDFDLAEHRGPLLHWIFTTALKSRFDAAVNTRTVTEYRSLAGHCAGRSGYEPAGLKPSDLGDVPRRISSVWLGMQALIRSGGPLDYPDGMLVTPVSPSGERAVALMRRKGSSARPEDLAIGAVLLEGSFLHQGLGGIGAKAFWELLREQDQAQVQLFLSSQLLPAARSENYSNDGAFVRARVKVMNERLQSLLNEDSTAEVSDERQGVRVGAPDLRDKYMKLSDTLGSGHPQAISAGLEWIEQLFATGKYAAVADVAGGLVEEVGRQDLGVASPALTAYAYLARSLTAVGESRNAGKVMEDMLARVTQSGTLEVATQEQLIEVASLIRLAGPEPVATEVIRDLLAKVAAKFGRSDARTLGVQLQLGESLRDGGNYADARSLVVEVRERAGHSAETSDLVEEAADLLLSMN